MAGLEQRVRTGSNSGSRQTNGKSLCCNGTWRKLGPSLFFCARSWLPVDYNFANYYHSHSPDSLFTQQRICTMPTPEGRTSLIDNVLKVNRQTKQERHVAGSTNSCLQQHFGLIIHEHVKR